MLEFLTHSKGVSAIRPICINLRVKRNKKGEKLLCYIVVITIEDITKSGVFPMNILTQISESMQVVLKETANNIARETGFIKRQRKISGSHFVQTLVFGWLSNPDSTIEELAQTAATLGVSISSQGLDKRFTPDAAGFLKQVLEKAITTIVESDPVAIPLLNRFNGVFIQDSSTITLPDCLAVIWSGCGGNCDKNTSSSVKTQILLDLNKGKLMGPYLQSGKEHDQSLQIEDLQDLPSGSVRMTDLGYFSLADFSDMSSKGIYWLSRLKSQCCLFTGDDKQWDLLELLEKHCFDIMDMQVLLGVKERIPCRILAFRVSDEVANERRRKLKAIARRKQKSVSSKSLKLANWTVFCTNIPTELLSIQESIVLMRTRWQIELIFKLWKSEGRIDEWRSAKPFRILCELYAKLLVMLIQHWLLLTGWQYPDRSLFKSVKTIRKHAVNLLIAFASGVKEEMLKALETIAHCLSCGCRINKRKNILHTYQLLLEIT